MAGDFRALLQLVADLGWDGTPETGAPADRGPYIRDMPHRILTLTPIPGPGYVWEGAGDAGAFQARVRGRVDDPADAETLAKEFDRLIFGAHFPVVVRGVAISHIDRLGGDPSMLLPGPDSGRRYEYVCSYIWITGV